MTTKENIRILALALAIVAGLTAEGYAERMGNTDLPVDPVALFRGAC